MALLSQKKNKIIWLSGMLLLAGMFVVVASRLSAQTEAKVDRIVVEKSKRTLILMSGTKTLKTYRVALGSQPIGAKDRQGDHKTPEGTYSVDAKNPHSQFYKALHISYPNQADRANARKLGVSAGGDVEIHGLGARWGWLGARHRLTDWTDGCIALTNEEIEEIYPLVRIGTTVEIRP
jgi:murein L,D-transpeptidase YafK